MYQLVLIDTGPLNRYPTKFTPSPTELSLAAKGANDWRYGSTTLLTPIPSRSMKVVRPAFCYQHHLRAGRTPFIRVVVAGCHAELLHRILGDRQHRLKR